jgi:hypothetical protein
MCLPVFRGKKPIDVSAISRCDQISLVFDGVFLFARFFLDISRNPRATLTLTVNERLSSQIHERGSGIVAGLRTFSFDTMT